MECPPEASHHLVHGWLIHQVLEAYIGRKAKEGNLPFGSVPGAVGHYTMKGLVFASSLIFSKKPQEGEKNVSSENSSPDQRP